MVVYVYNPRILTADILDTTSTISVPQKAIKSLFSHPTKFVLISHTEYYSKIDRRFSPSNFHFSGLANDSSLYISDAFGIPLLDACCTGFETTD